MSVADDNWGHLYIYLDKKFGEIDERFARLETRHDEMMNLLTGHSKRLDDDDAERAAITTQLDRHETWLQEIAERDGYNFQA